MLVLSTVTQRDSQHVGIDFVGYLIPENLALRGLVLHGFRSREVDNLPNQTTGYVFSNLKSQQKIQNLIQK